MLIYALTEKYFSAPNIKVFSVKETEAGCAVLKFPLR